MSAGEILKTRPHDHYCSNVGCGERVRQGTILCSACHRIAVAAMVSEDMPQVTSNSHEVSDGSTAAYYELPESCKELQDLISHRDMNAQMGEIFRAVYRYGIASHSSKMRDAKKIRFYIDAEISRLEKLGE
jgi:hypothetical protein